MKKIIIIVLLAALLTGAYVYNRNKNVSTETSDTNGTPSSERRNMDVVCNDALSYMSFPDHESAEQFVIDCKDGKHPEVVEHYKEQMNLGEGAAI